MYSLAFHHRRVRDGNVTRSSPFIATAEISALSIDIMKLDVFVRLDTTYSRVSFCYIRAGKTTIGNAGVFFIENRYPYDSYRRLPGLGSTAAVFGKGAAAFGRQNQFAYNDTLSPCSVRSKRRSCVSKKNRLV